MAKKKVKVSKERQVNTYHELWRTSYWTLNQAEEKYDGSYFQIMASLIFTAFSFEAYLNHLGGDIFHCWDDLERLSPQSKLNVLSEELNIKKDYSKRPFQTIKELYKFRNDIAHGKTIILKTNEEIQIIDSKIDAYISEPLEAEWQKYCTLDNAKKARKDTEAIMEIFHKESGVFDEDLFFPKPWISRGELINEQ